jgi:hypothetical protein
MKRTSVQRLVERLEREHKLLVDASTFSRVRAGHWQRSSGAWSWWMFLHGASRQMIGSQFSVKQLLKAKTLQIGPNFNDLEVDPA